MISSSDRIQLGLTLTEAGKGGIASVGRMTARSLIEDDRQISIRSLLDNKDSIFKGLSVKPANKNRLQFMTGLHLDAFSKDVFIYDAVGVARAHPRWPFPKRPYGVWMHGVEVWHSLSPARREALYGADFILVNSQFTLDRFIQIHGPLANARVCPLATELDHPLTEKPGFDGPPTVLIVGRMDKENMYKGHRELISAWPKIVQAVPDAQLQIVGNGNAADDLKREAEKSSESANIHFRGFVTDCELADIWLNTNVFAMPSRGEGFGLVYIEAMRHGVPVIASTHDAGQEVNVDGHTGYNVNLDRNGELEERLIELLRSPELASRLGTQAEQHWLNNYCFKHFKARLLGAIS